MVDNFSFALSIFQNSENKERERKKIVYSLASGYLVQVVQWKRTESLSNIYRKSNATHRRKKQSFRSAKITTKTFLEEQNQQQKRFTQSKKSKNNNKNISRTAKLPTTTTAPCKVERKKITVSNDTLIINARCCNTMTTTLQETNCKKITSFQWLVASKITVAYLCARNGERQRKIESKKTVPETQWCFLDSIFFYHT